MAVPDFQSLMRPLLLVVDDGEDHAITAIRSQLAKRFALSQADVEELIPSGRVTTLQNRVGWAATYLYRTKLIDRPQRAVYRITNRGRQVLEQNTERVDLGVLCQGPSVSPQGRPSKLPTGGHAFSPPMAMVSPRFELSPIGPSEAKAVGRSEAGAIAAVRGQASGATP